MRFSEWRDRAPNKESLGPKVVAILEPILHILGADADASCWIVWGEDPASRYLVFAISDAGLIQANVRVNVPQEGPRASGKLIRWNRVQTGELAIEMVDGHHLIGFQLEGQVLRASDAEADEIGAFALEIFAAIDGRTYEPRPAHAVTGRAAGKGAMGATGATGKGATKGAANGAKAKGGATGATRAATAKSTATRTETAMVATGAGGSDSRRPPARRG